MHDVPAASDFALHLERLWYRLSRERSWLTGMAGAHPLPIPSSAIVAELSRLGIDGRLLEIARDAIEGLDMTYITATAEGATSDG